MTNQVSSVLPQNLVALILESIYLKNVSTEAIDILKEMGATEDVSTGENYWKMDFENDDVLLEKLIQLNKLGFLFVGEAAGWPPAEVFDYMKERKSVSGKFKEIRWRGPGNWFIIER